MATLSTQISTGDISQQDNVQFHHDSKDEIGVLAKSLNRMILSLQMAIKMINED